MFACLSLSAPSAEPSSAEPDALEAVARAFSPRVEVHAPHLVTLDIAGLRRLLGTPAQIGQELVREADERGCHADVAIAGSRAAAMLLALACDGLTVVPSGEEARILAGLPIGMLRRLAEVIDDRASTEHGKRNAQQAAPGEAATSTNRHIANSNNRQLDKSKNDALPVLDLFRRWGLRTLGDLAVLPPAALSERIGQEGLRWQRVARGEDLEPLVAMAPQAPVAETLDLDWPVEGLEPLSFLLPRLLEPICDRLERLDEAAVTLDLSFRLATREQETRRIQLPAPMRDAKVLRTLVLLHLESHPLGAGVDRLTITVETAPARIVQFSLLTRALPFPEQMATLVARLGAVMGERRVGAPALVDSYRPGAFEMRAFTIEQGQRKAGALRHAATTATRPGTPESRQPPGASRKPGEALVIRRFRRPIAARVIEQDGYPVRVTTERRGLEGGRVESSAGPWRTSGEWWKVSQIADSGTSPVGQASRLSVGTSRPSEPPAVIRLPQAVGWNRDEWDVALSDGAVYRIYRDRTTERWFIEGILD